MNSFTEKHKKNIIGVLSGWDRIARFLNPAHDTMFAGFPLRYYWTSHETEWATDIAFEDPDALARIYPQLVRGSIIAFGSKDVLRFLGNRPDRRSQDDVTSSYRDRPEGIRVKHQAHANSVKVYDKAGSILRTECTIQPSSGFSRLPPVRTRSPGSQEDASHEQGHRGFVRPQPGLATSQ